MKVIINKEKVQILLSRAVSNVLVFDHLEKRLLSGQKLRVKLGIDPTAPDIHLGHSVSLIKLRQFQELGHQAVLIIGDFTARIGDPAGRTEARKALSIVEVKRNMKNYLKQAGKIIDIEDTEIHYNNEWFGKMKAVNFYELAGKVTIQQILKREDFRKRIENDKDITANEMMYPIFQGYDSVMVKADVEIGGEDQLVNLLMGRRIQRAYGMPEQDVLATWLIEGTDGERKMSKSFDNYIAISEKPDQMFGKIMSILDSLIIKYFRALTQVADDKIDKIESDIKSGKLNPKDAKIQMAYEIVKIYHGEEMAKGAESEFDRVFKKREMPERVPEMVLDKGDYSIIDLLVKLNLALSKNQARRLVLERAVKIGGKTVNDPKSNINIVSELVVQVGKRHFKKVKVK
ncbi:MAG: tyrosine--tRNA ligase [Candidatus Azambacteria bacterium]|nr:tyrosine--tRNA ligase [Candidatus Azambacteria bacterium]